MKYLYSSFLALLTFQVSAANFPTKIHVTTVPLKSIEATPKQKEEIYKNLDSAITQISRGQISLPEYINLVIVKNYSNAFYSSIGQLVVTPYQLKMRGLTKHPKFTRAVELHEFGHAVFEANYDIILRDIDDSLSVFKAYVQEKKKFEKEGVNYYSLMAIQEIVNGTSDANKINDLYSQAESALKERMNSQEGQLASFVSLILQNYVAYNEFFSDVFAVVLTKDPNIIRDALQFSSHPESNTTNRSFRLRFGKRTLDIMPHNLYGLSRQYIYKYYLSNPLVKKMGTSWILNRTLESIRCGEASKGLVVDEVSREWNNIPEHNKERFIIERMNDSLNACIDQEFSK